jgi:hypothetical protein
MVDVSVCSEETTPIAVGAGIVLRDTVDVKEEAVSLRESSCG